MSLTEKNKKQKTKNTHPGFGFRFSSLEVQRRKQAGCGECFPADTEGSPTFWDQAGKHKIQSKHSAFEHILEL